MAQNCYFSFKPNNATAEFPYYFVSGRIAPIFPLFHEVRWDDWYHFSPCALSLELELRGDWLSLAERMQVVGNSQPGSQVHNYTDQHLIHRLELVNTLSHSFKQYTNRKLEKADWWLNRKLHAGTLRKQQPGTVMLSPWGCMQPAKMLHRSARQQGELNHSST